MLKICVLISCIALKKSKTEHLWFNVGVIFCWQFSLLKKSAKMETTETINIIRLLFAMKLHVFLVVSTLWDLSPVDRCNLETSQIGGREILCTRFYYIDCGTTCITDIPSFRFRLSKTLWSIIRWFDSLEKGARQAVLTNSLRRFYYLYRLQYSDLSWHSIHILVGIFE